MSVRRFSLSWVILILSVILGLHLLTGCAQKPTTVREGYQNQNIKSKEPLRFSLGLKQVSQSTLIVDTRSTFDFEMSHPTGAVQVRLEQLWPRERALVDTQDFEAIATRLAAKGIVPSREILVVGNGPWREGEEYALAYLLIALGFDKVGVLPLSELKWPMINRKELRVPSVAVEKSNYRLELFRSKTYLDSMLKQGSSYFREGDKNKKSSLFVLIDGRTSEVFKRSQPQVLGALHIPREDIFAKDGHVLPSFKSKLQALGVGPTMEIMVVSSKGWDGAAIALALQQAGFIKSSLALSGQL